MSTQLTLNEWERMESYISVKPSPLSAPIQNQTLQLRTQSLPFPTYSNFQPRFRSQFRNPRGATILLLQPRFQCFVLRFVPTLFVPPSESFSRFLLKINQLWVFSGLLRLLIHFLERKPMWLRRTKSGVRIRSAYPPKFGCSSFKDIHCLIDEGGATAAAGSPKKPPPICHRTRSVKSFLRTLSKSTFPENVAEEEPNPEIRIPGAEKLVVVYFTSLRIVRRTFEDCKTVRSILSAFRVPIDERDLSMDSGFIEELQRILGLSKMSKLTLPRVFIGGRYIGGVDDVRRLHESGELKKYVEGLPVAEPGTCEACGGYRFVLCVECSGSHKCYSEKAGFNSCTLCNENGLIRCPSCSSAAPV